MLLFVVDSLSDLSLQTALWVWKMWLRSFTPGVGWLSTALERWVMHQFFFIFLFLILEASTLFLSCALSCISCYMESLHLKWATSFFSCNLLQMYEILFSESFYNITSKTNYREVIQLKLNYHCESPDNDSGVFPQCVDAQGFCLFLKTYLEVDDFPADFCQRLFCYFQRVDQDGAAKCTLSKAGLLL